MTEVLLAIQCKHCGRIFEIKVTRRKWREYIEENSESKSLIPCICGGCWDTLTKCG